MAWVRQLLDWQKDLKDPQEFVEGLKKIVAGLEKHGFTTAAAVDGASPWTTFRRVTLPMIFPAILSGTMLAFVLNTLVHLTEAWLMPWNSANAPREFTI